MRLRGVLTAKFIAETMEGIDLLHLPASAYLPPTVDESDMESSSSETLLGLFSKLTQFMRPFNFLGLPAISVPCGFSSGGLPIAYQLVGHPFAEATLLHAVDAYQRATDHHRVVPELAVPAKAGAADTLSLCPAPHPPSAPRSDRRSHPAG